MKRLSDSVVFTKLVNNPDLINKMKLVTSNTDINILTPSDLPNEFNSIERRINYSTKGAILDKVKKGIIIIYEDEKTKIPTYLNTIPGRGINGDINIYTNVVRYRTRSGEIYPKTLFALLQNSLIMYELMKNWTKYTNNLDLMKLSSFIYSRMTTKILDKVFALDLDNFNSDFMSYIFAKFFLVNMCERTDNELNSQLAYKCCFNKSSFQLIQEFEQELPDTRFDSIFELIDSLKLISAVKTLNVRTFVENFVRMYGESSLLALDYLPSFYQSIFSAAIGGNLGKDYMFESVCGSQINKAYITFSKIVG